MPHSFRPQSSRVVLFAGALLLATATLAGCRQDMHNEPKFFPQRSTTLFPDGRSVRPQVAGTVAREQNLSGSYFYTGMVNGAEGDGLPFKVTPAVIERGQERFNIYCSPCHSRVGNGKGMIVQRGYYQAANFHTYRLRQAPLGHFFSVITNGYGAMPDLAAQIAPVDRWAIAAYIRALQLSQDAAQSDVPSGAHVQPISAVLEDSGFSSHFLDSWGTPEEDNRHQPPSPPAVLPNSLPAQAVPTAQTRPAVPAPTENAASKPAGKSTLVASNAGPAPAAPPPAAKPAAAAAEKGDIAKGKAIYASHCSVCHQPTRAGMPPVFPSLIGIVDKVGEKRVRTVAKEGIPDAKPPMPPHPDLTDKDLDDLIAFLRSK